MNYITLDYIKSFSRVDFSDDDELLTNLGTSAETAVMNICNTTYEKMLAKYGEIPGPIWQATLMLVETGYTHRCMPSAVNLSVVPYTFDFLVKPYVVLADETDESSSDEI